MQGYHVFWGVICWISVQAQPPAGYYDAAFGLSGKALQQALHGTIDNTLFVEKIWGTLNPANILCEKVPGFMLYPNPAYGYL